MGIGNGVLKPGRPARNPLIRIFLEHVFAVEGIGTRTVTVAYPYGSDQLVPASDSPLSASGCHGTRSTAGERYGDGPWCVPVLLQSVGWLFAPGECCLIIAVIFLQAAPARNGPRRTSFPVRAQRDRPRKRRAPTTAGTFPLTTPGLFFFFFFFPLFRFIPGTTETVGAGATIPGWSLPGYSRFGPLGEWKLRYGADAGRERR